MGQRWSSLLLRYNPGNSIQPFLFDGLVAKCECSQAQSNSTLPLTIPTIFTFYYILVFELAKFIVYNYHSF